jgi:hypothetical protein
MKTKKEMKTLVNNYYLSLPVITDNQLDDLLIDLLIYFNETEKEVQNES